jgi:hypothetical protein
MRRDNQSRLTLQLAPAPADVRDRMLADSGALRPGAAAVVGRFFAELAARGESSDAPSRNTFDAVARSEPTLHTLLTTLGRYAPAVCLAAGREARQGWYRRRPKPPAKERAPARLCRMRDWPPEWAAHLPALEAWRTRRPAQTIDRYLTSIDRCAQALDAIGSDPVIDRWTAWRLLEHFRAEGLRWTTCANYLAGLDALARAGNLDAPSRDGVFEIVRHALALGRTEGKLKTQRLAALHEAGGYEHLAEAAGRQRDAARDGRAWTAAAERHLQTAAILALIVNAAPRSGDLAGWRLGIELRRRVDGTWSLAWRQGKTGEEVDFGELWPAVSDLLDDLVCRGLPRRLTHMRYNALRGCNWLTHDGTGRKGRWATTIVRRLIGSPIHDVRTLAFDVLRLHDPGVAAGVGSAFLGHRDLRSIEAYRSRDAGIASSRAWRADKKKLIGSGGTSRIPRSASGTS